MIREQLFERRGIIAIEGLLNRIQHARIRILITIPLSINSWRTNSSAEVTEY